MSRRIGLGLYPCGNTYVQFPMATVNPGDSCSARLRSTLAGWTHWIALLMVSCHCGAFTALHAAEDRTSRLRLLIETDAGGDPDDEQSLVRFLLYANEWDGL